MSHNHKKVNVPSWLIPASVITFGLLLALIVCVSRPCGASCHDTKNEKKEHSSVLPDSGQNYVTIETQDGRDVKVSTKLSNMISYLVDEKTKSTSTDNTQLQKKADRWKDKMANNNLSPSMTNFLDIVE